MLGRSLRHHNFGAIAGIGFFAFVALAVAFPQIGYLARPSNIRLVTLIYLFGLVVCYGGKYYRKSQRIDMELAFKQMRPE